MTKPGYYEVLDAILTDIIDQGGAEVTPDIEQPLLGFNRTLKAALELTN
jgi:hypothetical protein